MPGSSNHVLGVDIGNEVLKATELRLIPGRGIQMDSAPAVMPTPAGSVAGGVVVDANAVSEALRAMIRSRGFTARRTVASVGGDTSCAVRIAELPRMTGRELAENVRWELDRQAPFPTDKVCSAYVPIEFPDLPRDNDNMELLLAVAQEDMVDAHITALRGAKLNPVAIDIEPLAISRALVNVARDKYADKTVLLCNMGATSTGIYFVRKGTLNFIRFIPNAGDTLTGELRQRLSMGEAEAERYKRQFADLSVTADGSFAPSASGGATAEANEDIAGARQEVYDIISGPALDMATELRRSVDYYRRQHRNEEVNLVLLCGGTALLPGIAELVAAETGVETAIANPFEYVRVPDDASTAAYLRDVAPLAVISVGLAMRDMVG